VFEWFSRNRPEIGTAESIECGDPFSPGIFTNPQKKRAVNGYGQTQDDSFFVSSGFTGRRKFRVFLSLVEENRKIYSVLLFGCDYQSGQHFLANAPSATMTPFVSRASTVNS
jgi:hypothetical protein